MKGLRRLRVGAVGARPAAFNTVRYSEKILESNGISIEPIDLSEIFGRIHRMKDDDPAAQAKLAAIRGYVATEGIPGEALLKMAKLGAVIDGWMTETNVAISAVQCWTSLEEYFGVVPCTVMSMMSNELMSSACEVDICGVIAMHALRLASGTPSALLDWNNNYGEDPDKCGVLPLQQSAEAFLQRRQDGFSGDHRGHGGQGEHIRNLCRPRESCADDATRASRRMMPKGKIRGYLGEGEFTNDPLETFGGAGVARDSAAAESAAVHLRARIRASRRGESFYHCRRCTRGSDKVSRLGNILAHNEHRCRR